MNHPKRFSSSPTGLLLLVVALLAGLYFLPPWRPGFLGRDYQLRAITARGDLAADEQSTIDLFQEASPSVVYLTTLTPQVNPWTLNARDVPSGTGSGFIGDAQGQIVTNFHVIENATAAQVTLFDHQSYSARLIGISPRHDLAVLRIQVPAARLRPIPLGVSQDLKVGQKTFAIGNPFGLDQTLTTGIVSALNRTLEGVSGQPMEGLIQTDAAINPGNSGGPLLDSAGRLIGVDTAIFSPSGAYAGIGFAVPVDIVNRVVPQLIANGRYTPPQLGVIVDDRLSHQITQRLGVPGLLILSIREGSPAAAAGLRPTRRHPDGTLRLGDILLAINGQPIRSSRELTSALESHQSGDTVTVEMWRDNFRQSVNVELE
ncbi:MAG: trypsin-like peptidase domain-containing protein [Candidatus Competibacteraceae bacterium]